MKYFFLALLLVIIVPVLILFISSLFVRLDKNYKSESPYFRILFRFSVALVIKVCRVRIHVSGMDKIPRDGRFLLVSNHCSNFDPIVQWYALKDKRVAFLSKESNLHIPIFGKIAHRCFVNAIDRDNPRKAFNDILEAAELVKSGEASMGVYPEGTRSKTGELLEFHDGVFYIAQEAKVPTVVCVIRGTREIHNNFPFRRSDVFLDFAEVIPPEETAEKRTGEIGLRVRGVLERELNTDMTGGFNRPAFSPQH